MPQIERIVIDPDGTQHIWRPHRYPNGKYKLARPDAGDDRNLDGNTVWADDERMASELIAKRFSIRMSEGDGPPSLIGPDSVTIRE